MINHFLLVFLGGGIGSTARYGLTHVVARYTAASAFPWPILSANILGALLIGMLMEILALRISLDTPARFFLVTGFLGGFTTFSAFSLEAALMLEKGDYVNLSFYIAASVIGTIAAVFLGSYLVKLMP